MNTIQIKKKNAVAAYRNADAKVKKLLEELFGKENLQPEEITERIKTFEDVLEELGDLHPNHSILLDYNGTDGDMISAQAFLKLTLIARALNEGWEPDWSNDNERKYVPWFTHKSGFGLSCHVYGHWRSDTLVSSRLCYKTSDLAIYAAKQFADIYNDFLTIK